jgi:hypothetical protein
MEYPIDITIGTAMEGYESLWIKGEAGAGKMFGVSLGSTRLSKTGLNDLLVANAGDLTSDDPYPTVYIFNWEALDGDLDEIDTDHAIVNMIDTTSETGFGWGGMVAVDFNYDSDLDLAISAHSANYDEIENSGRIDIFLNTDAGLDASPSSNIHGENEYEILGYHMSSCYDMTTGTPLPWRLNGVPSSSSDQAILAGARQGQPYAAPQVQGPGYAGLWYVNSGQEIAASDADIFFSPSGNVDFYYSAYIGDVNGDGYVDIAVGDPSANVDTDTNAEGQIWFFY